VQFAEDLANETLLFLDLFRFCAVAHEHSLHGLILSDCYTSEDVPDPAKDSMRREEKIRRGLNPPPRSNRHVAQASHDKEICMILVTGAAGLSGSAVVREFAGNGVPVRALVRHRGKAGALVGLRHVQIVEGDMARAETLGSALEGIARVLLISSSNPQMFETQCRFIETCKGLGVAHVVKFSGKESSIGFNAQNFRFTRMHEEIERYLQESGLAWTHLRPSQFMQVYLREVPTIAANAALLLPLEDVKLSPVDIDDVAKIAFAILVRGGHEGSAFDITGPQALSMAQIAACIGEAIGKPILYHNVSPEDRRRAARGRPARRPAPPLFYLGRLVSLQFLAIERMFFGQRPRDARPLLEARVIALDRAPSLQVDRRRDVPIEHGDHIGIGDAEVVEQEFTPSKKLIKIGQAAFAYLKRARFRLGRHFDVEQRYEQSLVQLGPDKTQPLLQARSRHPVGRR
jgi:uncharacterized protein YbjT (DUF2867 family)